MRKIFIGLLVAIVTMANAQGIHEKIDTAVKHLLADSAMKHAIMGLHVVNSKTGEVVYDANGAVGLAPASTQKIFTSIAALEILGSGYKYKTEVGYTGAIKGGVLDGWLVVKGYGDPSFGSWRFTTTKRDTAIWKVISFLKLNGIYALENIMLDGTAFSYQPLPGGWIWDDIGNYYGAGTWAINWNENQYDVKLQPGNQEGEPVKTVSGSGAKNFLKTGKSNSGDEGYIYRAPYTQDAFITGTEPAGNKEVTISGSLADPPDEFGYDLTRWFEAYHIKPQAVFKGTGAFAVTELNGPQKNTDTAKVTPLGTYYSPPLDSLVYWFLQKSINLYGEAFIKTIAYEKTGYGETEKGVELVRDFWAQNGIEKSAVKIIDGSGLSPQNRVTAQAEVQALQYAKTRGWYNSFYADLPTFNGMKMKSGTIGGSKAFAGYQKAADGNEYTFSIIINNYDGSASAIVQKMYAALDVLK